MVEIGENNILVKTLPTQTETSSGKSRWNYSFVDPSFLSSAAENGRSMGRYVKVHRRSFWGIQTVDEYEGAKRRKLQADFRGKSAEEIVAILEEHPVHVVALPMSSQSEDLWHELDPKEKYALTVLDGHHRIRYLPKIIKEIPTIIFTVEEAFEAYRKRYKGTLSDFVKQISTERDEAIRSFTRISESFTPDYVRILREGPQRWRIGY